MGMETSVASSSLRRVVGWCSTGAMPVKVLDAVHALQRLKAAQSHSRSSFCCGPWTVCLAWSSTASPTTCLAHGPRVCPKLFSGASTAARLSGQRLQVRGCVCLQQRPTSRHVWAVRALLDPSQDLCVLNAGSLLCSATSDISAPSHSRCRLLTNFKAAIFCATFLQGRGAWHAGAPPSMLHQSCKCWRAAEGRAQTPCCAHLSCTQSTRSPSCTWPGAVEQVGCWHALPMRLLLTSDCC